MLLCASDCWCYYGGYDRHKTYFCFFCSEITANMQVWGVMLSPIPMHTLSKLCMCWVHKQREALKQKPLAFTISPHRSLATHTNTLDTCIYTTMSLCEPLPCNISLIGLVELCCLCTHTHPYTHSCPCWLMRIRSHTIRCHTHPPHPVGHSCTSKAECGARRKTRLFQQEGSSPPAQSWRCSFSWQPCWRCWVVLGCEFHLHYLRVLNFFFSCFVKYI